MYPTNIPIYCRAVLFIDFYYLCLLFGPPTAQKYTALRNTCWLWWLHDALKTKWNGKKGWYLTSGNTCRPRLFQSMWTVWMDYPVAVLAAKSGLGDTIPLVIWNNRLLCGEAPPPLVPTRRHSTPSWALRAAIVLAKGQRTPFHFPNEAGAWLLARLLSEAHNIVTQHRSQPVSSDKSMMGKCTSWAFVAFYWHPILYFFWWSTLSESKRSRSLLLKDALRR